MQFARYGPDCANEMKCPHTSFLSHLGGAIAGFIVGIMVPVSYTHLTLPTNREV